MCVFVCFRVDVLQSISAAFKSASLPANMQFDQVMQGTVQKYEQGIGFCFCSFVSYCITWKWMSKVKIKVKNRIENINPHHKCKSGDGLLRGRRYVCSFSHIQANLVKGLACFLHTCNKRKFKLYSLVYKYVYQKCHKSWVWHYHCMNLKLIVYTVNLFTCSSSWQKTWKC